MESASLHVLLRSRRSVRRFNSAAVPRALLERALETASFAPSAHNRQPWRYVAITSPEVKASLARDMGDAFLHDLIQDGQSPQDAVVQVHRSRSRIESAPVVVVLCADFACADEYPDPDRRAADSLMLVQDTALGGMQFMLAAHAEGLATVWMCAPLFAPETVRISLALPDTWEPQALILVGYSEALPAPRPRRPLVDFVRFL